MSHKYRKTSFIFIFVLLFYDQAINGVLVPKRKSLTGSSGKFPIKIVQEPATHGSFHYHLNNEESNELKGKVAPANFSGPSIFTALMGKCYNYTSEKYLYQLCPFQNMTQHEISSRWNAYKGILGIWQGWVITNGTFSAMRYTKGEDCGSLERNIQVNLLCSENGTAQLLWVKEPSRCHYTAEFQTPLACGHNLLVYPSLPKNLQKKWDHLYSQYHYNWITYLGYEQELKKIYKDAKLIPFLEPLEDSLPQHQNSSLPVDEEDCLKMLKKRENEISALKTHLRTLQLLLGIDKIS